MAFSIKDPEADRLVRQLAAQTGETLTEAVVVALRERLQRVCRGGSGSLAEEIERIARRNARRPLLDPRSDEAIIGYDETGLFP